MEKIAFVMTLKAGFAAEYKKRHDKIWPELVRELKQAGISDYSIYLHPTSLKLFGVLKRTPNHAMDELAANTVVRKWWAYMADIMDTNPDNSPVVEPLEQVFHLQ
ncbi:MAG: L-rhamnose mutarotase [Pseudomonadota bacterium]